MNEKNVLMNSVFWEVTRYNNMSNQEKQNINQRMAAPTLSEIVNFYVNVKKCFKYNVIFNSDYPTEEIIKWSDENCKGPWKFENNNEASFTISDDAVLFKLKFGGRN